MDCSVDVIHFPMKPLLERQSVVNVITISNTLEDYLRYSVSSTHPDCVIVRPVNGMLSPWADTDIEIRWDSNIVPISDFQNLYPPMQPRLRIVPSTSSGELAACELGIEFSMPRGGKSGSKHYLYIGKVLHANPQPLYFATSSTVGVSDVLRYENSRSRTRVRALLTDDHSSDQSADSESEESAHELDATPAIHHRSPDRHLCSTCCVS
eukprot:TRINITY_DN16714_c0_g1_i1.p1 TRINITY_DN16714_c0_g1~~TRINITY_DN16714_c0_g1_i1.p1  ORF type:complete len:209 (+),score=13.05 TRINITY_DN16714_c0_g1_i1:42-668(+)